LNGTPLLIYSGLELNEEDRMRLQLGNTEFLRKSEVTPEELQRRVADLLNRITDSEQPAMSPPGRLLIVDDEDDIRLIARMSLERIGGWEAVDVGSAEDAVEAARSGPLDVILLDVMMPGVDGPAALELLRPVIASETPVIFLTAKTQAPTANASQPSARRAEERKRGAQPG
jgi:CheY-like chemotaxis protein